MENDFSISVDGATDQPVSNSLEKGRYVLEVTDLKPFNSGAGNSGVKVTFIADYVRLTKPFVLKDIEGNKHQMSFQWRQFLHAIGLRDKRATWEVNASTLIGKKCLGDVIKKKDEGFGENEISSFSPIEEAEAPITGVPPENEVQSEVVVESTKGKKKDAPITVEAENTDDL